MRPQSLTEKLAKSTTSVEIFTFVYLLASSSCTAFSLSFERATSMTFMPFLAISLAMALPMPSVAPVTTAHSP